MAEELRFFLRTAAYTAVIGVLYWIVSYEWAGSVMLAWGSLQSTPAVHSTEIRQLQGVAAKYDSERAQDRADLKELIRDVKSDVKDVKNSIDIIKAGQK